MFNSSKIKGRLSHLTLFLDKLKISTAIIVNIEVLLNSTCIRFHSKGNPLTKSYLIYCI